MDEAISNAEIGRSYCMNPIVEQNFERARSRSSRELQQYRKTSSTGYHFPVP